MAWVIRSAKVAGDWPVEFQGFGPMTRSGAAGFNSPAVAVASPRLRDAVAASLAIASLSLCLIVTITVLSSKLGAAMTIPA
jgi:hypothetical protein